MYYSNFIRFLRVIRENDIVFFRQRYVVVRISDRPLVVELLTVPISTTVPITNSNFYYCLYYVTTE